MTGRFGSVITAMVTPFRDDRAVDLDRAQELARWLIANGSDAVVVAGSTGEAPTLSAAEKAELFRAVGEAIRGQGKMLAGVGTYATAETLELAHAAADGGRRRAARRHAVLQQAAAARAHRALHRRRRRHRPAGDALQHPGPHGVADRARHAARARRAPEHRRGEGLDRRLPGGVAADRRGARRVRGLLGRRLGDVRVPVPRGGRGRERREPPGRHADPPDGRPDRDRRHPRRAQDPRTAHAAVQRACSSRRTRSR